MEPSPAAPDVFRSYRPAHRREQLASLLVRLFDADIERLTRVHLGTINAVYEARLGNGLDCFVKVAPAAGGRHDLRQEVWAFAQARRVGLHAPEVLAIAAVLGREFDADVLERVSGQSGDAVDEALTEASAIAVLAEPSRASEPYRFTHALVRETLLRELPIRRRVRLHRQVAEALEAHYGQRAERHAAELAHHYGEAAVNSEADAAKAIRYGRLAGEQAEAQTAWEEATRHYERCLALMAEAGDDHPEDEAALLVAAGRAYRHTGDPRPG
jgi:predicted ATPase